MKGTRIFLERANFGRFINLHLAVQNPFFQWAVARPVAFEVVEDDSTATETQPMLRLEPQQAQLLMDELWQVGLRPTQGHQSEGQMAATTKHLNDMRSLVSALAKVELPKP